MSDLRVTVGDRELAATWTDGNPETRAALEAALPVSGASTRWGDELYFGVPVDAPLEDGQTEVPVGALAFWPPGSALCLFWGPTPASRGDEPRAASPVNVVATIEDVGPLEDVDGDASVTVERD
ncbi:MAG: cyclophilin-like family protein [Halobacteriota archaeon]